MCNLHAIKCTDTKCAVWWVLKTVYTHITLPKLRSKICFYHPRCYLLSFPVNPFCSRQPWSDFYHHRWGSYHGSWTSCNWSIEYIFFCAWLPSLNIMFVRCIHIDDLSVVCSFLLLNSIPFPVDAHLNYFKFLMTKNKASMYSLVKVFFFFLWT